MKETKVYIDELPKCIFCPMLVNLSNIGESEELMCCLNRTAYCNDYSDIEKIERNFKIACPLKSLKTHDRELAIQELEKVKEACFNQKELVDFGNVACFMVDIVDILEIVNNQIKELKGVNNDASTKT